MSGDPTWYVDALLATLPHPLDGLHVVVDCANGAASAVAESVYSRAGAAVTVVNTELTGEHINEDCGATHLEVLQAEVLARGADAGIAHDGDADRCLAVTAAGQIVDGDAILAMLALDLQRRGELRGDAVATTVMSNLGLTKAMRAHGITVEHHAGRRPARRRADARRRVVARRRAVRSRGPRSTTPAPATGC